jgi:hypothetical protein
MQVGARTAGAYCRDLDVQSLDGNVVCGARLLDMGRRRCGGEPLHWLGWYNRHRCGETRYARRVLALWKPEAP